jgi:hypothetical protein
MGKQRMKKRKKGRKKIVKFDTDNLAKRLYSLLADDFRSTYSAPRALERPELLLGRDIKMFREYEVIAHEGMDPRMFKWTYQMQNLFKKYRFKTDVFTDSELQSSTIEKHRAAQSELCRPLFQKSGTHVVLQEARKIARQILGKYPEEDMLQFCRIGAKSNIGCPLSHAYLDIKLSSVEAFTSTAHMTSWFVRKYLPSDPMMQSFVNTIVAKGDLIKSVESLFLRLVPKAWNKLRPITPLTLVALFYSYGVGALVEQQLKKYGLNIRTLQKKHAAMVRRFSNPKTYKRTHGTADLSNASGSILLELLMRVLPRDWFTALRPCLTNKEKYSLDGGKTWIDSYTMSVLPMGNAATFPVETLVFYSIIKAIGNLSGTEGIFSVYGDDLIYPIGLHKYVIEIFPDLGFTLNMDKTYMASAFRESCGSDCFRGVDVRPFFFPGEHRLLTRSRYCALLYQVINGLRRRWRDDEIRQTLRSLCIELAMLGEIFRVPPLYPDYSGIKVGSPDEIILGMDYLPWADVQYHDDCAYQTTGYEFSHLKETAHRRVVKSASPYLWDALRSASIRDTQLLPHIVNGDPSVSTWIRLTRKRKTREGRILKIHVYRLTVATRVTRMEKDQTYTTLWSEERLTGT